MKPKVDKHSPCYKCKHRDEDKQSFKICIECLERIKYDLSITDPRLAESTIRIMKEDDKRWAEIKDESFYEPAKKTPRGVADERIIKKSKRAGFNGDIARYLWFLYNEKKWTLERMSRYLNITASTITLRLHRAGYSSRAPGPEKDKIPETRYCQQCGKSLTINVNKAKYATRKFCSIGCSNKARARIKIKKD